MLLQLMSPDPVVTSGDDTNVSSEINGWRRQCGCIRTSEKLKKILTSFPAPPPPSPLPALGAAETNFRTNYCVYTAVPADISCELGDEKKTRSTSWQVVAEVVQLVQLTVTATALALYYLIYCYMQLVYYTLRSALYFHNADVPMKITIGVVTVTSIVVGFNLLLRMERVIGILY